MSSDLQKKERTIESQITELKSQIKEAGAVLVNEYIDDGYSGARLSKKCPGLQQKWSEHLAKHGLSPDQATRIASRSGKALADYVNVDD